MKNRRVLLPYEFTLFSNLLGRTSPFVWFYYLMNLHYSQTKHEQYEEPSRFTTL